jgi:nitrilase
MSKITVAALQIGSDYRGKQATLANILSFEDAIASSGAALVVMPEALLGGYPKGEHFGTRLGFRLPEGREAFARYYDNAVDIDGPELAELADLGTRTGATLVVGVIERAGASLFCTAVFIEPERGVVAKHRKLMPTGTERLIWSQGDGPPCRWWKAVRGGWRRASAGKTRCRCSAPPCMPRGGYLVRPTVDEREVWRCSMRHIAHEGRMFVISCCQVQPSPPNWAKRWSTGMPRAR